MSVHTQETSSLFQCLLYIYFFFVVRPVLAQYRDEQPHNSHLRKFNSHYIQCCTIFEWFTLFTQYLHYVQSWLTVYIHKQYLKMPPIFFVAWFDAMICGLHCMFMNNTLGRSNHHFCFHYFFLPAALYGLSIQAGFLLTLVLALLPSALDDT